MHGLGWKTRARVAPVIPGRCEPSKMGLWMLTHDTVLAPTEERALVAVSLRLPWLCGILRAGTSGGKIPGRAGNRSSRAAPSLLSQLRVRKGARRRRRRRQEEETGTWSLLLQGCPSLAGRGAALFPRGQTTERGARAARVAGTEAATGGRE